MAKYCKYRMRSKKRIFLLLLLFGVILLPITSFAQDCFPDPNCSDIDIPLDNEVWILIAAGALYGIKKIRDHQRGLKIYSQLNSNS